MLFRIKISVLALLMLLVTACGAQKEIAKTNPVPDPDPIAFPGAEGFGKYTSGGRGGKVFVVSNLNDDGQGSFREAAEKKEPRIIVFAVSGTIHLQTKLSIKGNATIAGQTAPGDGICIADQPVSLGGDNIIMRYMRIRMGDKYQRGGMVHGNGFDDAFGGTRKKHIIIDHCSFSWSTDEVFSVYAGDSTTLQWNLIAEPLNYSYHFETGENDYQHHGYGGIWGGAHTTAHHNVFAHCKSRTPRFDGIRNAATEFVDFRNNIIYNWGNNNVYAGEGGNYNIVNNYYKYGPETSKKVKFQVLNPNNKLPQIPFGKFYVAGNYVDGSPEVTNNNHLGVIMGNDGTEADKKAALISSPHAAIPLAEQPATDAYEAALKFAGASFKRDTMDTRIMEEIKNRTGNFKDVQGGYAHGTAYELTTNAWPSLQSSPVLLDTDKDGMPDAWEKQKGLDPADSKDAALNKLHPHFTNIEVYINSLLL